MPAGLCHGDGKRFFSDCVTDRICCRHTPLRLRAGLLRSIRKHLNESTISTRHNLPRACAKHNLRLLRYSGCGLPDTCRNMFSVAAIVQCAIKGLSRLLGTAESWDSAAYVRALLSYPPLHPQVHGLPSYCSDVGPYFSAPQDPPYPKHNSPPFSFPPLCRPPEGVRPSYPESEYGLSKGIPKGQGIGI